MEIKVVKTNQEFLDLYGRILDDKEIETQLMRVNLQNKETILEKNSFRGAVMENDEIKLLFLNALPFNLLLLGVSNSKEASVYLIETLIKEKINFAGVSGNDNDMRLFLEALDQSKTFKLKPRLSMDSMKLSKLNNIKVKGYLKKATKEDLSFVSKCIKNFHIEALNEELQDEEINKKALDKIEGNGLRIYYNDNNEKTSIISIARALKGGRALSLVYTLEEHRNHGYGTFITYLASKEILDSGCEYVTLYVEKNNPISNKVYLKVGFEYVDSYYDMRKE